MDTHFESLFKRSVYLSGRKCTNTLLYKGRLRFRGWGSVQYTTNYTFPAGQIDTALFKLLLRLSLVSQMVFGLVALSFLTFVSSQG